MWKSSIAFRLLHRLSLRRKILLIVLATCLVVFLVCSMVFQTIYLRTIEQNAKENLENAYQQKYRELEDYLANLDSIAYTVMFSSWAQDLVKPRNIWSPLVIDQVRNNVTHFLSSLSTVNNDIRFTIFTMTSATVQNNNTMVLRYDYQLEQEPWYDQLIADKKYMEYTLPDRVYHNAEQPMLLLYYPINDNYSFEIVGYLMIGFPQEQLRFLEELPADGYTIQLTDLRGEPLVDGEERLSDTVPDGFQRAGDAWGYGGPMPIEGWRLQIRYQQGEADSRFGQPFRVLFLLMLPVALFCMVVTLWFSQYLTNPILRCKKAILAIRDNQLGIQVENGYTDEIGELIDGLNDMSTAIANLIDQNRIMYLLKRDAEFEALQQRINPHFLYNTLEIINGLILDGRASHAIRLCEILGQMFRYNLDDRKWVTVGEECDYIREYLTVLGYSSAKGPAMVFEVDPGLEHCLMLKFIMQPIVENSVRHGFREKKGGCLTITVEDTRPWVRITIMDNGCGIESEALADLQAIIRGEAAAGGEKGHIGLRNVYQRLALEYGDAVRFAISSVEGRGTKTEISIPREGRGHG